MTTKLAKKSDRQKTEAMLDALYRGVIRKRAMQRVKGCECCERPKRTYAMLHTAHMFGRGHHTVRWDVRNSAGICFKCHRYLDTHRFFKEAFFRKLLGGGEFDKLSRLAHKTTKDVPVDYVIIENQLREELKELDGS